MARDRGDLDELFRVYANLTTVLDLLGRRGEAVDVANEGVEASRRAGLEAVFGNFLRANASDSLYLLGRWAESSDISATALEWSPGGAIARPIDSLAMVEIETHAGEVAGRQLGQILVGLDTVSDAQHAVPIYRAAASLALWQGDHADAGRAAARGWELVKGGGDWSLIAKMASTVAEVEFGGGRRRDGPARPGGPGLDPGAVAGRPEGGPSGRRAVARRGDGRVASGGRCLARPGERPSRTPRGPRRSGELGPAGRPLEGARQSLRAREGPLARGRGDPRLRRGAASPGSSAGAPRGGGPASPSTSAPSHSSERSASSPGGR